MADGVTVPVVHSCTARHARGGADELRVFILDRQVYRRSSRKQLAERGRLPGADSR